jgi:hypothetical protein
MRVQVRLGRPRGKLSLTRHPSNSMAGFFQSSQHAQSRRESEATMTMAPLVSAFPVPALPAGALVGSQMELAGISRLAGESSRRQPLQFLLTEFFCRFTRDSATLAHAAAQARPAWTPSRSPGGAGSEASRWRCSSSRTCSAHNRTPRHLPAICQCFHEGREGAAWRLWLRAIPGAFKGFALCRQLSCNRFKGPSCPTVLRQCDPFSSPCVVSSCRT